MNLEEIIPLARKYATCRAVLAERVQALNDAITAVHRRKMRGIKAALASAKDTQATLENAIKTSKTCFEKPRTQTIEGIKFGLQKSKAKIECSDEEHSINLIEKIFPDKAPILIATKKSLVKSSLDQLSEEDLKLIGVNIVPAGDTVLIKDENSALDKLVESLLKVTPEMDDSPTEKEVA